MFRKRSRCPTVKSDVPMHDELVREAKEADRERLRQFGAVDVVDANMAKSRSLITMWVQE